MTKVYYKENSLKSVLEKPCANCGHKLSYHGFTEGMDYPTKEHYLNVLGCTFCDCKRFEEVQ